MSDLHNSLVETYLHMRYDNSDSTGKEDNNIDINEGVYKAGSKLRPSSERSERTFTPKMRAAKKREEKRSQDLEDKADRVLADPQVRKQRRLVQPKADDNNDTKPTRTRRLPSQATDPKRKTKPSLDDLLRSIQRESYSYSNWRRDLFELVDTDEVEKKKNKKIGQKAAKNKVTINPSIDDNVREAVKNLGGVLLEANEMNFVDYIYQVSEYLYENNYDESDIEEFLEMYSSDDFMNLLEEVDEFMNLNEARRSGRIEPETKTGKNVGSLKGGAKTSAIRRLQKLKQERKDAESAASASKPSGMTAALKSQSASASRPKPKAASSPTTSSPTPKKKGALDRIAGAVLKGIERHKAATATAGRLARETGKTLSKAASVGSQAAKSFGSGVSSGVRDAATAAKKTKNAVVGEETVEFDEKRSDISYAREAIKNARKNQKQYPRGQNPKTGDNYNHEYELSKGAFKSVVNREREKRKYNKESELDEMNIKKARKDLRGAGEKLVTSFKKGVQRHDDAIQKRKTKQHDKILSRYYLAQSFSPEECEIIEQKLLRIAKESIDSKIEDLPGDKDDKIRNTQSDTVKKQQISNQKRLLAQKAILDRKKMQMKQQGKLPMNSEELIPEASRLAKETGKTSRGRDYVKGGTAKNDPVFQYMSKQMGDSRVGVQPRGKKKTKGQKPPSAGEYGSERKSPEQIVKNRRHIVQKGKENMSSRFD